MNLDRYAKAIAAAVTLIGFILASRGVELDARTADALVVLLTTFAVWVVPNRG